MTQLYIGETLLEGMKEVEKWVKTIELEVRRHRA